MLKINKGNVPREFYESKRIHNHYDDLREKEKDILKAILLNEQNNRCAYCTRKIELKSSTIEHYVPRNGENGDASKSLDYNNLFAVCKTTRNLPFKHQTCDVRRGNKLLRIDPRLQSHIDTIRYDKRGKISSDNNDFDYDLDFTLNLNEKTLLNNRFSAFDSLMKRMIKKKSGKWTKEFIQHTLDKYKSKDDCTPYAGFIIYQLEKRLQRFQKS